MIIEMGLDLQDEKMLYRVFHNQTEFLSAALINGKTLGEAWDELEVY